MHPGRWGWITQIMQGWCPKAKEKPRPKVLFGWLCSLGIPSRSPGLCVPLSQRSLSCSTPHAPKSSKGFLLLRWSSMAIGVRTRGFPTPSKGCSNSSSIAFGGLGKSVHLQSSFMEFEWVSPPLSPRDTWRFHYDTGSVRQTDCPPFTSVPSRPPQRPDPPLGPQKWVWEPPSVYPASQ